MLISRRIKQMTMKCLEQWLALIDSAFSGLPWQLQPLYMHLTTEKVSFLATHPKDFSVPPPPTKIHTHKHARSYKNLSRDADKKAQAQK